VTKSWLQAVCKTRSKSRRGRQTRVWAGGASFARILGESHMGREGKKHTNK